MSTEGQIPANCGNARASTGPRTPQGESILAAGFRVLTNENREEFDGLIAEYHRTFAPATTHERFLVWEMAQFRWRLARARRLEATVVEQLVGPGDPADSDAVLAAAAKRSGCRALNSSWHSANWPPRPPAILYYETSPIPACPRAARPPTTLYYVD